MQNTNNKSAKPVTARPQSQRQEAVNAALQTLEKLNAEPVANTVSGMEFEKISQRIDFYDFEKSNQFTGVYLGAYTPENFSGNVHLFSELDTNELFYVPDWHALQSLYECTGLCETVYMIVHKGVKKIGNNQTYHLCDLYKSKTPVESRYNQIPDFLLKQK